MGVRGKGVLAEGTQRIGSEVGRMLPVFEEASGLERREENDRMRVYINVLTNIL